MRILHLIPTIQAEGAQRMAATLCRGLLRAGHEVGVVSLFDPQGASLEPELREAGVAVELLGKRMGLDPRMFLRVPAAVSRFAADVVHTHLYVLKYLLPGLGVPPRVPVVHTMHSLAEREGGTRLDEWVQWGAFRRGVTCVSIGEAVSASLERLYGVAPHRTIPNGIDTAAFAPPLGAREELRGELRIPGEAPVFAMIGRLAPAKDHALALAALADPRLRARGARLLLAGDGPLRAAITAEVQARGLSGAVHLLGARRDVARVLAAADVFLLSSRYEGHPLSVLEAMAAGKPVVATAVGCVPETVSAETGRLVPPGDAAALAAAMDALAADTGLVQAMGEAGRRVARERYDVAVMADAYGALYRELVGARCAMPRRPGMAS